MQSSTANHLDDWPGILVQDLPQLRISVVMYVLLCAHMQQGDVCLSLGISIGPKCACRMTIQYAKLW